VNDIKQRQGFGILNRIAKNMIVRKLEKLQFGQIKIVEKFGDQEHCPPITVGRLTSECSLKAKITIFNPQFYSDLAFAGSIGAGESYMLGYWKSDSLTTLVQIFVKNAQLLDEMEPSKLSLVSAARKTLHWINRNTKQGSRKNIAAHYDIGNNLFELFLDPTMMYSCGIFSNRHAAMHEASLLKLHRICESLKLKSTDHLVEIGSGWGGLAIYAAENYGCRVTTTTISKQQYDYAKQRIEQKGLQDKITLLLKDYRDLEGNFDKLISIEMIEAVGHEYYSDYFKKCASLLKPDGAMLIQAITISDQRFDQAKNNVDFIQRYIFPGSCIPSTTALLQAATHSSDLKLMDLSDIGLHYATTLKKWREQFFKNIETVRELGYSEQFIRMWEFYFCYCEGGFLERAISDVHMVFIKPQSRLILQAKS